MDFHFTAKRKPTKRHKKTNKRGHLKKFPSKKGFQGENILSADPRCFCHFPATARCGRSWLAPSIWFLPIIGWKQSARVMFQKSGLRDETVFLMVSFSEKFSGFLNLKRLFSSMPTVYNSSSRFLRKRKCFCTDCKGKLRSVITVKRHRSLSSIRGKCDSLSLFECYLTWNKQLKHVLKLFS